jgi:hypothetical protein
MLIATVYVLTGLVWTGRSVLEVLAHPDYWDPVTSLDWLAIWSYSLAFALLALTIPLLARDSRAGRLVDVTAVAVSLAAVLASVANVVEDAFAVTGASTLYVIGALGTLVGLVALCAGLWLGRRRASALVVLLILVGMTGMVLGMGWLVLAGGVLAARNHLAAHQQTRNAHA